MQETTHAGEASLLEVRGLRTHFPVTQPGKGIWPERAMLKAVDGVDFTIARGKTLGLVGESGSGKSTVARSVLQLIKPVAGEVHFEGRNLCQIKPQALRALRPRMQIIFQDPYASLDPRQTVGFTVGEPLMLHGLKDRKQLRQRVTALFEMVGLNPDFANRYPHEFSGGQRQRVGIARALATNPDFVVADEPISALDISIQAQIINLLRDLQTRLHLTYLFISHDLRAVRYLSDEVAVMYLGKIVEIAPTATLFARPQHPYTQALLQAVPVARWQQTQARHEAIAGEIPSPIKPPTGCAFSTRCPHVMERCRKETPLLGPVTADGQQKAACFLVNGQ